MSSAIGYAAQDNTAPLAPFSFERRARRDDDVQIAISYCGVCHSDLHQSRDDWKNSIYPVVPGHEIVGSVTAIGSKVTKFVVGDAVAVGCMVDSCLVCDQCTQGCEQYCVQGCTGTYNGRDRHTRETTFGGYSDHTAARQESVLRLPEGLDPERVAPLLCAGITTWSPMRHWKVGAGSKVGVVGLEVLGHMGVKLAVGLGADVTVITTSASKTDDALALGAHAVLLSSDPAAMKAASRSLDFILDTVPVAHDVGDYLRLLKPNGAHVIVGAIDMLPSFHTGVLLGGRKTLSGSAIGGVAETQELLDFCAKHDILPLCETIAMQDINHAYERMERSDVNYHFVIDMSSLRKDASA